MSRLTSHAAKVSFIEMTTPQRCFRRSFHARVGYAVVMGTAFVTVACASTGATFRSGVGDRFLEHPPYYTGQAVRSDTSGGTPLGHLPIAYQRGASQPSIFDPSLTPQLQSLLAEMNAFLDSLGVTVPLVARNKVTDAVTLVPPDVQFGCAPAFPDEDCAERGDSALGRKGQTMRLAVGGPDRKSVV